MCPVSVQNIIRKCTIKCLREESGLLSSAMHPPPPSHPENHRLQGASFQHVIPRPDWSWATHTSTQGAPEKVLEACRCFPGAAGKRCWASYKNTRHSSQKMLLSKAKVTSSSPHHLALLLRGLLPHPTRGDSKGGEPGRGLYHTS